MWVNYARDHTGFVLGFNAHAPFFEEDGRTLRQVVYQQDPPLFASPDENGCFYKSPDWKYEKEWRCVRSFTETESRLVEIDPTLITEIIFGSLMEAGNVSKIVYVADVLKMNAAFSISSPASERWKFINKPTRVATCKHCSGQGYTTDDV
jgi:hypothetical protein